MKKYQQFVNNVKNKTVYLRYMKNINSNNLKKHEKYDVVHGR